MRLPALDERGDPLRPGDSVLAIGSPGALESTVTAGIVSAVERDLPGGASVQMDVPISPGSSGGPILDEEGEVAAIATATRIDLQSVNYAVPIDLAADAVGASAGGTSGALPAIAALLLAGGLLAGAVVWLRGAGSRAATAPASPSAPTPAGPATPEEEPLVIVRRGQSPPVTDVTVTKRQRTEKTWT
jgi:S1-C subfamily serine protease